MTHLQERGRKAAVCEVCAAGGAGMHRRRAGTGSTGWRPGDGDGIGAAAERVAALGVAAGVPVATREAAAALGLGRRALAAALSPQKRVSVAGERWPCARRGVFPAECDCLLSGRTLPGWTEAGDGGTELGVLFVPAGGQNTRAAAAHGPAVRGWRWAAAGAARYDFFLCVWRRAGSGKQAVSTVGHLEACLAQAGSRGGWAFSGVALRARRQNAPQPERVGVQF